MGRENRATTPYDVEQEPELPEVIKAALRSMRLSIRTHCPAKVLAYDPARNVATVEVGFLQVVKVTDPIRLPARMLALKGVPPNAEAILQPLQLVDIPVQWPATNLGRFTLPLATGDTGTLHVMDRSMEVWMLAGVAADPVLAFTHALKDSVFQPGLRPTSNPFPIPVDTAAAVVEAPQIKLGATATEKAVKATSLVTALVNAVNASAVGSMDGGATFKANLAIQLGLIAAQISAVKTSVE